MKEELFDEYIEKFKKLPLQRKKDLTIEEIKEILAVIEQFKSLKNLDSKILLNNAIIKTKSDNTYDEFVEAIFVYMHSIQESLAEYLESIIN